ncbi:MAG: hypothetical protein ACTH5O_02080, partial [Psychrobacter sp.]
NAIWLFSDPNLTSSLDVPKIKSQYDRSYSCHLYYFTELHHSSARVIDHLWHLVKPARTYNNDVVLSSRQ